MFLVKEEGFAKENLGKDCPDYEPWVSESSGSNLLYCKRTCDCFWEKQGFLKVNNYCSGCLMTSYTSYLGFHHFGVRS